MAATKALVSLGGMPMSRSSSHQGSRPTSVATPSPGRKALSRTPSATTPSPRCKANRWHKVGGTWQLPPPRVSGSSPAATAAAAAANTFMPAVDWNALNNIIKLSDTVSAGTRPNTWQSKISRPPSSASTSRQQRRMRLEPVTGCERPSSTDSQDTRDQRPFCETWSRPGTAKSQVTLGDLPATFELGSLREVFRSAQMSREGTCSDFQGTLDLGSTCETQAPSLLASRQSTIDLKPLLQKGRSDEDHFIRAQIAGDQDRVTRAKTAGNDAKRQGYFKRRLSAGAIDVPKMLEPSGIVTSLNARDSSKLLDSPPKASRLRKQHSLLASNRANKMGTKDSFDSDEDGEDTDDGSASSTSASSNASSNRAELTAESRRFSAPLLLHADLLLGLTEEKAEKPVKPKLDPNIEVCNFAKSLRLPINEAKQAYDLFREFAETPAFASDFLKQAYLTKDTFLKAVKKVRGVVSDKELTEEILTHTFKCADRNKSGNICFKEFAIWFSSASFSEDLFLTEEQRAVRQLAKKWCMDVVQVEGYKRVFDKMDADGSGLIEANEFEDLLCTCGRVPRDIGLPPARVKDLWRIADLDGNGTIDFEEFVLFYRKYFDTSAGGCGFSQYYRGIRRVSVA